MFHRIIPYNNFFAASGLRPEFGKRYSSMLCTIMHPLSRGSVHIVSEDPFVPPAIDTSACFLFRNSEPPAKVYVHRVFHTQTFSPILSTSKCCSQS